MPADPNGGDVAVLDLGGDAVDRVAVEVDGDSRSADDEAVAGQSLRSFASLTLCVSVCPHVTVLAGVAEAVAVPTASAPASISATIVAVLRMSLISCLVGWVSERAPSWATTPLARRGSGGARRCRRGS